MNIGIYVTSLRPHSPSQARLQEAIFAGLENLSDGRYRFFVFSDDAGGDVGGGFTHRPIARRSPLEEAAGRLVAWAAALLLRAWGLTGVSGGRMSRRLAGWSRFEPKHHQQLRDLDIRLLWNMNQHELPVPVPFIRTIWEANHRIHSMYPEYSYARFGFDGCEGDMADSLARAAYVITGTHEGKRQIVDMLGVYEGKIRVVPFPAPTLPAPTAEHAGQAEPYIFYPARFWPHKNHVVILEALKVLRADHGLALRCVFTGADEGNLDYVLRYAERIGVGDLVDYKGRVPEAELASLYRHAAALVFASAVGPDNLPPLEAMAFGCPVIAADVPGAREQYGDAALYFPSTDEGAMAKAISSLVGDEALRARLTGAGKARVEALTADAYAKSVLAIFDEFAAVARAWERCDSAFT